jgi:predicted AAA+ superfamily ATPase
MIKRIIEDELISSLGHYPVIGIIGPRQSGKTTLAKEILKNLHPGTYLDLELPSDYNKLTHAELLLSDLRGTVVIDEIQVMPELFPLLRSLIDRDRTPGKYIILGSTQPALIRKASESLAGRVKYMELQPLVLKEVIPKNISLKKLWLRGGFPLSLLAASTDLSMDWRQNFIRAYIERDIPLFGLRVPAIQMRRFWGMLAHIHGQILNSSQLASSMGLTNKTVKSYIDLLSDLFIIRQLLPFHTNTGKRLVKSPKIYFRDTGILHTILSLRNYEELMSHPVLGASWEGFLVEQITAVLKNRFDLSFYRTHSGAEIDLVIGRNQIPEFAVEIKFSSAPKASKGFFVAMRDLNISKGFILYPGNDEYPVNKDVTTVSAEKFILNIENYIF